ncbi:uncharacterized protein LOC128893694 [Hylaeus anthracinus]|uniref:uncharacterized protein LOC128893694 n=1 Tax=Hylaeus anthracinus TaxID=313031 RepID=UPI0023BA24CC|nr:uncharacterized protein LOC128893694 [Hylaeus anthracinus]
MSIRESILSIGSRMVQRLDDDINFDVMTYEELQQMQDDILQKIWMMTLENDVYERYITRHDPQIMKTIIHLLERSKFARRLTAHLASKTSHMSFRESIMSIHDIGKHSITSATSMTSILSGSRLGTSSIFTMRTQSESAKITMAHRILMANKEVEEMRKKLEDFTEAVRKRKAHMRAEIEELQIRTSEVHEAKEEFEEEVVVKGVDPITGKIPAERVIRWLH